LHWIWECTSDYQHLESLKSFN